MGYALPSAIPTVVVGGRLVVVSTRSLDLYDTDGVKVSSIPTPRNVERVFGVDNIIGIAVGAKDGTDLHFFKSGQASGVCPNVASCGILDADLTTTGKYCVVATGIPEFQVKVIDVTTGKILVSHQLDIVDDLCSLKFNPSSRNEILLHREKSVTKLTVEDFDANRSVISAKTVTLTELLDRSVILRSARIESLWNRDVDDIPLRFEIERQATGKITGAVWKDGKVFFSTTHGEVYFLRDNGDFDEFLVSESEIKNSTTLTMESFIPCVDGIQAMTTTTTGDLIWVGEEGIVRLRQERMRKGKKVVKTLRHLSTEPFYKVVGAHLMVHDRLLIKFDSGEHQVIDVDTGIVKFNFHQTFSKVVAAALGSENRLVVARESNQLELFSGSLSRLDVVDLESTVLVISSTATKNIFFAGTTCGHLIAFKIELDKLVMMASTKLFQSNLTSIVVDTFNRALVVGSNNDDKVIILSWSSDEILPTVSGFLPVDGIVKSLSTVSMSANFPMYILASIGNTPEAKIDAVLGFELSPEVLATPKTAPLVNNLMELDQCLVKATTVMIPPCSSVTLLSCVSSTASCWAASVESSSINQLEFTIGKNYPEEVAFVRQLSQWATSALTFTAPFHSFWIAQACRSGQLTLSRNMNQKFQLPTSAHAYHLTFDRTGETLLVYSGSTIEVISLGVKTDMLEKIQSQGKGAKVLPVLNYSGEVTLGYDRSDWFQKQVKIAAAIEDQKYKAIKAELSHDLDGLREVVEKMMLDNDAADDLEKLDNQDFNLDKEQADDMAQRELVEIEKLRLTMTSEIGDYNRLVKEISDSCWTNMDAGTRSLNGFYLHLSVNNFEIVPITKAFGTDYENAKSQREEQRENAPVVHERTMSVEDLDEESEPGIHPYGTITDQLIEPDTLLDSQFGLTETRDRKVELLLIENRINLIKRYFNQQFDIAFRQKQSEITRIGEKNARIQEISSDIGIEFDLLQPQLDDQEMTENVFTVKDTEVNVKRVLTEDQQAQLDEERRLEDARRGNTGDNLRDRALTQMMDGVLEVKSEDVLKIDVPRPAFMDDPEKMEGDWTEDEVKEAKEYDKKVITLEEDRVKYKRTLEIEAKKTQQLIIEAMHTFDLSVQELNQKRLIAQMAVDQEHLRLTRIQRGLTWDEEADDITYELEAVLKTLQTQQIEKRTLMKTWMTSIEDEKEEFERLSADDKLTEKSFKLEFDENNVLIDQLFKAFKRRPKQEETMDELEKIEEGPVGVEEEDWAKTIELRKDKIKKEAAVRVQGQKVNLMKQFYGVRENEAEKVAKEIDDILTETNSHEAEIKSKITKLLVQILLKQGQVEVEPGQFLTDYTEAQFIHRRTVEEMNEEIKQFGNAKIDAMIESADFRKGIHSLEWDRRKLDMEKDDLVQKAQDIQLLKLTRELQAVLLSGTLGQDKTNQDLARLDRNLKAQNEQHKSKMQRKQQDAKKLRDRKRELNRENLHLDKIIDELHVSVSEKRNIKNGQIMPDTGKIMRDHAKNRQLAEIGKRQHNEISVLKQEVERLRKKTFPALVKVTR